MRSRVVAVRCFAEECREGWEAHCVDLGVTVRGETLEGVKRDLDRLVHERIDDTLVKRRTVARDVSASARGRLALRLRYWGLLLAGRLGVREDALRSGAREYRPREMVRAVR